MTKNNITKGKKINSQTLYLKYRPQNFSEVLGQEEVVSVLESSLKNKNISHAYLFSGTHGTGKTSLARIFAKTLGSSNDDIYEIDAASNRGIGEIREIRDSVDIMPLSSDFKVYIIDEAHMLTKEASNALLKTLEEPPKHVIFILATTESQKVLPTILSRCTVFAFNSPNIETLSGMIESVSKLEKRTIDKESVKFIASLGNKSFRDTLSNLQKVFSVFDKKIEYKKVREIFADSSSSLEDEFLEALALKNKDKVFEAYFKINEKNLSPNLFLDKVINKIRISLLVKNSPLFAKKYQDMLPKDDFDFLKNIKINSLTLKKFLELEENLKLSSKPKILMEIFLDNEL